MEEIATSFSKNMLGLKASEETIIVKPEIKPFDGVQFARDLGMPRKFIEELESSNRDVVVDWKDDYGFFGMLLTIYTKKHVITLEIPFSREVVIDISSIPAEIRTKVKKIIKRVIGEAVVWTNIPYTVRQEIANIIKAEAYNSLKRLKS